jgi:hypothetical protein
MRPLTNESTPNAKVTSTRDRRRQNILVHAHRKDASLHETTRPKLKKLAEGIQS